MLSSELLLLLKTAKGFQRPPYPTFYPATQPATQYATQPIHISHSSRRSTASNAVNLRSFLCVLYRCTLNSLSPNDLQRSKDGVYRTFSSASWFGVPKFASFVMIFKSLSFRSSHLNFRLNSPGTLAIRLRISRTVTHTESYGFRIMRTVISVWNFMVLQ